MENLYQTPILLLIFNRMSTTVRVFEKIKEQKPKYLFIASDGARHNKEGEQPVVESIRKYVLDQIDWDCEVKTLFRDQNFGCGVAPYTAITWFFKNVEKGIILEDDCLPLPGFFSFCEEMLNHYKDDKRIYEISGHNLQAGNVRGDGSYYFSNYGGIWGWATWARAWEKYDYNMSNLEEFISTNTLNNIFLNKVEREFWLKTFSKAKELGSWWDYQWLLTIWHNGGICIVPNGNLIINIGFDGESTHTINRPDWYNKAISLAYSYSKTIHPKQILVSDDADRFQFALTNQRNLIKRGIGFLKRTLKWI